MTSGGRSSSFVCARDRPCCVRRSLSSGRIAELCLAAWSGPAAPVVDAVVVGSEPVPDAPEDGLGAATDLDLAVDRADVGLDGVRAEEAQRSDLGVVLALGDEGENLGFAVGESLASARPVEE